VSALAQATLAWPRPARPSDGRLTAPSMLLLVVVSAHTILDYSASKGAPGWRFSFALVALTALFALFLRLSARAALPLD
jgi:hypothetical protein